MVRSKQNRFADLRYSPNLFFQTASRNATLTRCANPLLSLAMLNVRRQLGALLTAQVEISASQREQP
jgi:hypothetical protein